MTGPCSKALIANIYPARNGTACRTPPPREARQGKTGAEDFGRAPICCTLVPGHAIKTAPMAAREEKLQKKSLKQQYKLEKKQQKTATAEHLTEAASSPSWYVRFAESTKGLLYTVLAVSTLAAVVPGESGLILTPEDSIDSRILANPGKVLIVIIAVALFTYGLKNLRILK